MSINLVCLLYLPVFCWKCVNKLRLQCEGAWKYLGESVTGMGIWVKEKTERFGNIYSNWGFQHGCWQMCRWTTMLLVHMFSGFPAGRSKQTIVMSWNDVTRISCAIFGENYKRRAHPNLRAVWVFWYWMFGSTNKSQTLYSSKLCASHGAEHNQNELCVSYIHMHIPRPFWGTFSQSDFSCLTLAG